MSYVKITNGVAEIYTIGQLRRDNPNVSFPKILDSDILVDYNLKPLTIQVKPNYDETTQTIELGDPELVVGAGGKERWARLWSITDLPQNVAEEKVRAKRDQIIKDDIDQINAVWWNNMTAEEQTAWETYRQDLLDIPQQVGFPFDVIWPDKPE
jgi:hypothetical protein